MNEPISDAQLEEWERLADAAAPGEWVTEVHKVFQVGGDGCVVEDRGLKFNDAEFIAASRTAVPALIAEIRRLRLELEGKK